MHFYKEEELNSVEAYLCFLEQEVNIAVGEFEKIIKHSNIIIPPERFEKNDIFTSVF